MDVRDPYAAYCLDSAVGLFGRTLENELASVTGKGKSLAAKRNQLLHRWLEIPMEYAGPKKGE